MVQLTALEAQSSAGTSSSISTQEGGHYRRTTKDSVNLFHSPLSVVFLSLWSKNLHEASPLSCHHGPLALQPWATSSQTQITETQYPNQNNHFLLYPSEVLCSPFPATSNSITDVGVTRSPGRGRIQNAISSVIVPLPQHEGMWALSVWQRWSNSQMGTWADATRSIWRISLM